MSAHAERVFAPARPTFTWWSYALLALLVVASLLPFVLMGRALWGVRTLQYQVTPSEVAIRFGPTTDRIPLTAITAVRVIQPTGARRVAGTGMPGLQEGRWRFAETGPIRLYSTSTRPLTVIETAGGKWGISPADPEAFRQAVLKGSPGAWEPVRPTGVGGWLAFAILGLGVPALIGGLLYVLVRFVRGLCYVLKHDALVIYGGLRPVRIAYDRITGAEAASPPGTPWKTMGAAAPGIYWGGFHWKAAGPGLNLYASRYRPLVLVRCGKSTYGITPADPDGFLAALRARLDRRDGGAGGW